MKSFLITFLIVVSSWTAGYCQDVNAIIKEAERLEASLDESAAFLKFSEVIKYQPANLYAITKCSELCSKIGKRQTNSKARESYYSAAKTFAELAIKLAPDNSDANLVMAMSLGHMSMARTNKERLTAAKDIKKYVDASIKANPNNYKAWHVLGRWHYEISNLNAFERAAARLMYGGVPSATIAQSIKAFEKVDTITGGFVLNYIELAKAYHRNDDKAKAIELLKKALVAPIHTQDDPTLKEQAKMLLSEWQ